MERMQRKGFGDESWWAGALLADVEALRGEERTCAVCGDSIPAGQAVYREVEATMRASDVDAACWLCRRCA